MPAGPKNFSRKASRSTPRSCSMVASHGLRSSGLLCQPSIKTPSTSKKIFKVHSRLTRTASPAEAWTFPRHRLVLGPRARRTAAMAKTDFKSVDEYIATQPENVQAVLQRVRGTIRKAVPRAEEVISYQIPAYKISGSAVLYFAGWKQHYSLYPASDRLVKAFKGDLAPYKVSKGTIRFPLNEPVPAKLIAGI